MMKIIFDDNAEKDEKVQFLVQEFLNNISTLEQKHDMPIVIFQDGVNRSYFIKCSIQSGIAASSCDTNAKLDFRSEESFRANRELLLKNQTYLKMEADAGKGREFNDIIVEYNTNYVPEKPLKIWGGQHRISAITKSGINLDRCHGFRIYFNLEKNQRTELALISNTNISVSNDTFDRMIEETTFGDRLRSWSQKVGFFKKNEDFPDVGSRSEKITVKKARSFIVNFYLGKEIGKNIKTSKLDTQVYEPYLVETGVNIDQKYKEYLDSNNILNDKNLFKAGQRFFYLHNAQYRAVKDKNTKINDNKGFRNKAMIESVLCGWSFIAGLLQSHKNRLENHYKIPKSTTKVPDPLNAEEMSNYKHDSDGATYRGLGTRSALKDRQRIAQLFLAKSSVDNVLLDKTFLNKAVSTVVGLLTLAKGYTNR